MHNTTLTLLLFLALATLAGCGQMGPLYMPPKAPAAQQAPAVQQAPPAPAPQPAEEAPPAEDQSPEESGAPATDNSQES